MKTLAMLVAVTVATALGTYIMVRPPAAHMPPAASVVQSMREVARLETLDVQLYKKVQFAPEPQETGTLVGDLWNWAKYNVQQPQGRAIVFAAAHLGLDLNKLDASQLRVDGSEAWLILPPVVATIEMKPAETEVIASNLDSQQTTALMGLAKEAMQRDVDADRALQERARKSAERALRGLLMSLGFTKVYFCRRPTFADRGMIAALLAALSEPEQRMARAVEWLERTDVSVAVQELAQVVAQAEAHQSTAQAAMLSLVNVRTRLSYQRLADLYVAADDAGLQSVKMLLSLGHSSKQSSRAGRDNELVEKTLGERKALAMTRDRFLIDRLMRDRNPQVIEILLRNPRLTEKDVVRIAAQQPIVVPVIETLMRHHKWLARYAVKKALVFNPYTPRHIATSLMATLLESDRAHARRLLFDRDEV